MPRTARTVIPGLAHHITHRGNNRQTVFFDARDAIAYYDLLRKYTRKYEVSVQAHALMPNHVHLMLTPGSENGLAKVMGLTARCYAQHFNGRYQRSGHLWGDRYYSCVLDGNHQLHAARYIEQNPERANLVEVAWLYGWSSAAAHVGEGDAFDILSTEGWHWDEQTWKELLQAVESEEILRRIRRATSRDIPLVSEGMRKNLEAALGRELPSY